MPETLFKFLVKTDDGHEACYLIYAANYEKAVERMKKIDGRMNNGFRCFEGVREIKDRDT